MNRPVNIKKRNRKNAQPRPTPNRRPLLLETLEERLPPGDTILGALFANAFLTPQASFGDGFGQSEDPTATTHLAVYRRLNVDDQLRTAFASSADLPLASAPAGSGQGEGLRPVDIAASLEPDTEAGRHSFAPFATAIAAQVPELASEALGGGFGRYSAGEAATPWSGNTQFGPGEGVGLPPEGGSKRNARGPSDGGGVDNTCPDRDEVPIDTPPDPCTDDCCDSCDTVADSNPNTGSKNQPPRYSARPVRYFDGAPKFETTDLSSNGFGKRWSMSRSFSAVNNTGPVGNGWVVKQLPYLVIQSTFGGYGPIVAAIDAGTNQRFFDQTGSTYTPRYFVQDKLTYTTGEFQIGDSTGGITRYFDLPRDIYGNLDTGAGYAQQVAHPPSGNNYRYGAFKSYTDAAGNLTVATYDSNATLLNLQRTDVASGVSEQFVFSYATISNSRGGSASLVSQVTLQRQASPTAPWLTVRSAAYTYYTGEISPGVNDPNGRLGDLKLVTIKDAAGSPIDSKFYRYYKFTGDAIYASSGPTNNPLTTAGPAPLAPNVNDKTVFTGLKSAFEGASFSRLAAAVPNYATAGDDAVRPYVDNFYQYERWADANWNPAWQDAYHMYTRYRVTQEIAQGAGCSSCTGGLGTYSFQYTINNDPRGYEDLVYDPNIWRMKNTETMPDGNQSVAYTNEKGQVMLQVFVDITSGKQWGTFNQYDGGGRLIMSASPSALALPSNLTTFQQYTDLLHWQFDATEGRYDFQYMNHHSGLVRVINYAASTTSGLSDTTAGNVAGYFQASFLAQGDLGVPVVQETKTYFAHTGGGRTIYPMATDTSYGLDSGTASDYSDRNPRVTRHAYTWYAGGDRVQTDTVTKPPIPTSQNGPASTSSDTANADTMVTFNDAYGRPIWAKDADGFIHYTAYDMGTGAVVKTIRNIDYTKLSPAEQASFNQTGWSQPSGGLHLVTTMQVDGLGRTTQWISPNANPGNGNVVYAVYNDPMHEIRKYRGWHFDTALGKYITTGPITVQREYRPTAGAAAGQQTVYAETLTSSALPRVDSTNAPTGQEAIDQTNIQNLSRSTTNNAGQVDETDSYFSLGGVTYATPTPRLGTASNDSTTGNYHATFFSYDKRGRRSRVQMPTGTIQRTVYDILNRPVCTWVGTSDTDWPTTDSCGGTLSNMIQDSANIYDGGGVGDSNLTSRIDYPSGVASSADQREVDLLYDWRDRRVVSKQGVQTTEDTLTHRPILYSQYNNLNEVIVSERYDGDGVTPASLVNPTTGVPNRPSATLLRAQTKSQYDDQGRVFESNVFSVDQSNGTVSSNSLKTDFWYDHRRNLIKQSAPGGIVTKTAYDGASRAVAVYTSDGLELGQTGTSWQKAQTIAGDTVVTQTENLYDKNSNMILVTRRDRFHDASALGALKGATGAAPNARVSFVASYFDNADRLTDRADFGTNGGLGAPTIGSTPPGRSDQVLVTSTGYKADQVVQVALGGNPTGGTFTLTFSTQSGSQTTAPIAYNAVASDVQSALQALSNIGSGNALASGPTGGPWLVRFAGTLGESAQQDMTASAAALTGCTAACTIATPTLSRGGDAGRAQKVTDPLALISKTDYDLMGRTLRTTENFMAFAPGNASDRQTEFSYDGMGDVLTRTAKLSNTIAETTRYVYGVTNSNCSTTGSCVNSNDLLLSVAYPGQSQLEQYAYNALAQTKTKTDRNGNQHQYSFDVLGRPTSDAVSQLGTGVDNRILRVDTGYNGLGLASVFTSYNSATATDPVANQVNQVQRIFNGLRQLITENQIHGNSLAKFKSVQYTYSEMAGGANHSRLTSLIYPNGRTVNYNYAPGLDNSISRLTSLQDNGGALPLETYSYLGLSTVAKRGHPEPGVDLTYINQPGGSTDGGDQYTGLDRFGRVIDQLWTGASATDRFQYTYDRDSNRSARSNAINMLLNEGYNYDSFNQLTRFTRNTHTETWTLDNLGNWNNFTNDQTGPPTENRTHNVQNQITSIDAGLVTPTYDFNGDTSKDERGNSYFYDAWNRLTSAAGVSFSYDALNRRITENPGNDLYYSKDWQLIQDGFNGLAAKQYVWSPVYLDALVLRDDNLVGQRLYVQQDANWNVTAIVGNSNSGGWGAQERYVYDPYGKATVLDPIAWTVRGAGSYGTSSFGWVYLHQGGRYTSFGDLSGLYHFRNRDLSPTLGRWMEQDPIGYAGGDTNLYRYVGNRPGTLEDPLGLFAGVDEADPQLAAPRYPLDPNSPECVALAQKIKNVEEQLNKRWQEYQDDKLRLPWTCPGDDLKPSLSQKGHLKLIEDLVDILKRRKDEYRQKCQPPGGTGPGIPPVVVAPPIIVRPPLPQSPPTVVTPPAGPGPGFWGGLKAACGRLGLILMPGLGIRYNDDGTPRTDA